MADLADIEQVVIRPLQAEDLPALEWDGVYEKYRGVFRQSFIDAERGQRILLVAVAGPEMVGQVFIQLSSSETRYADGAMRGYLYALRVRPAWQGLGVGTRLIHAAEEALLGLGFTTAVIAAGKDNPRAYQLYERLGYRTFADDPGVWYFVDVNGRRQTVEEPCWVMEKRLRGKTSRSR
jgi:ribosomal protein S18 acetylase RimI-like enzyme